MTRLVVVAFALALPVMGAVARYAQNQRYGLEPLDPARIALAMAGLGSIAVIGALVPPCAPPEWIRSSRCAKSDNRAQ